MRKGIRKLWKKMSPVDRSFLVTSYEHYKNLYTNPDQSNTPDSFSEWLFKRGVMKEIKE